jgi:O-antigen/teichoic acid export membrane protein
VTTPVARPLGRNIAAILTSRCLTVAVQFVAFAALAARLGPGRLGVYAFAISFAALFTLATDLGLRGIMTREAAQQPGEERRLVPNVVYTRLLLAPLAFGLMTAILFVARYPVDARRAALIAGLFLLVLPFESFQATLEIHLKMRWSALADVVESILMLGGILWLVHRHASVDAFIWLYVGVNALNVFGVALAAVLVTRYRWRPEPATWWPLLRMALPLGFAGLFISLYFRIDIAILSRIHPGTDVGQYGAGYRFLDVFTVIPGLLLSVLTPVLARSVREGRAIALGRYRRALHLMLLLAAPVAVAGAATAARLVPALPGFAHYRGAGVTLAILAPGAAIICLCSVVQALLVGAHGERRLLKVAAICLALNLALNVALIPPFSYVGAALATSVTEVFVLLLSTQAVTSIIGRGFETAQVRRALRAAVVLGVALALTSRLHPYAQVAIGAVVYLLALIPTGSLQWDDLGGILTNDGMRAYVARVPPETSPNGTRVVVAGTPLGVYRQLHGCHECVITGPAPAWVGAIARLARCGSVIDVTGRQRRGLRRLFLDQRGAHRPNGT